MIDASWRPVGMGLGAICLFGFLSWACYQLPRAILGSKMARVPGEAWRPSLVHPTLRIACRPDRNDLSTSKLPYVMYPLKIFYTTSRKIFLLYFCFSLMLPILQLSSLSSHIYSKLSELLPHYCSFTFNLLQFYDFFLRTYAFYLHYKSTFTRNLPFVTYRISLPQIDLVFQGYLVEILTIYDCLTSTLRLSWRY